MAPCDPISKSGGHASEEYGLRELYLIGANMCTAMNKMKMPPRQAIWQLASVLLEYNDLRRLQKGNFVKMLPIF